MTEVIFFEDFYCFEYHSPKGSQQRFRYYLYAPVYVSIPLLSSSTTLGEMAWEKPVFSSDFLPSRITRRLKE